MMREGYLAAEEQLGRLRTRRRELAKEISEMERAIKAMELLVGMTKEVICPRCNGSILAFDAAPKDTAADRWLKPCPNCKDGTAPVLP